MKLKLLRLALVATAASLSPFSIQAQNVPFLLFDGEKGEVFAGCLNCNKFDDAAVCNKFGKYGSKFEDLSIWNQFGKFGSKFETNSPWNSFGEGLRIVDQKGNYYGRFTLGFTDRSAVPLVSSILSAYKAMGDLDALRDLLCEQ
ncbi:MAG: hypothetical protein H2044_01400 [Rhizobiales bacterium]|nr:hypothetical protein [Hyphomicrobiales bacterium]